MIDCTTTCDAIGAGCATCEHSSRPDELPTMYRPRRSPFHQAACDLVAAAQRNEADALDAHNTTRGA